MGDPAAITPPAVTIAVAATIFAVMFTLGLAIDLADLRWALGRPALLLKGLLSALVLVPVVGITVAYLLDLPLTAQVGVALMVVAPGAPIALRRSIEAGGHHSFAAVLQLVVALLAIVSMPVSIAWLNRLYETHGAIAPGQVARQVFLAQLLPLGLGLIARRAVPALADRVEPVARRLSALMLAGAAVVVVVLVGRAMFGAAPGTGITSVLVTGIALAMGHVLGGPSRDTRTAVAVSSALRNPGLALLVATSNHAPPEVITTILAYLLWAVVVVTPYLAWRRRARPRPSAGPRSAIE